MWPGVAALRQTAAPRTNKAGVAEIDNAQLKPAPFRPGSASLVENLRRSGGDFRRRLVDLRDQLLNGRPGDGGNLKIHLLGFS